MELNQRIIKILFAQHRKDVVFLFAKPKKRIF